jgi:hypothetical protein
MVTDQSGSTFCVLSHSQFFIERAAGARSIRTVASSVRQSRGITTR